MTKRWQAVDILDCAKQLVMVEPLGIDARPYVRADNDRRNGPDCSTCVLVEGDDEQAVVALGPERAPDEMRPASDVTFSMAPRPAGSIAGICGPGELDELVRLIPKDAVLDGLRSCNQVPIVLLAVSGAGFCHQASISGCCGAGSSKPRRSNLSARPAPSEA